MYQSRNFNGNPYTEPSDGLATEMSLAIADYQTRASIIAANRLLLRIRGTRYGMSLNYDSGDLADHDIAILRFVCSLELIESDVWQQYDELAGLRSGAPDLYRLALQSIDPGTSHFITSCAFAEISHSTYLNTFFDSEGLDPVNFDQYRVLSGSRARGAQNVRRLTNLQHINLDLAWLKQDSKGAARLDQMPPSGEPWLFDLSSIPSTDMDLEDSLELRAIAKTAAFHVGQLEDVVATLYGGLSRRIRRVKILKIIFGVGSIEISHLHASGDLARKALPEHSLLRDGPMGKRNRPFKRANGDPWFKRILPRIDFPSFNPISDRLNESASRSNESGCDLAMRTVDRLAKSGLFIGQSRDFMRTLFRLAMEADLALRASL